VVAVTKPSRPGGRAARRAKRADTKANPGGLPLSGFLGGKYKPLSDHDVSRIHESALHVLEHVGLGVIGGMPPGVKSILESGCWLNDDNRVCIPPAMVEDAIAKTRRRWTLHGLDDERSLDIRSRAVHFGTAGGAVEMLDFETSEYRDPTIADVYDVTRLIDTLDNIRWCYRPIVARDFETVEQLDINTAYSLVSGTTKPLGVTIGSAENVKKIVAMFDMVLGGEGRFAERPFCHMLQGWGVPPLQFAYESCLIFDTALRKGMPIMVGSASQAGASAPAALAGSLVQTIAEALAGLVYVNHLAPGHPVTFGPWTMVVDLRTGANSGGGGEQAVLMAASAQMGAFYGLPSNIAAGMTDSKLPDTQSGMEKAYTTAAAGLAGGSMIHESAGMHAALLGCAYESLVIDNDMLENVMRMVRGIEVNDETLSLEAIADVNLGGPRHYLGHPQTLALMETEYRYPRLIDRKSPAEWQRAGRPTMVESARDYVRDTLRDHYPSHIDPNLDARIRERFDIKLPREAMQADNGRW
jgi:trimethylamine--corrinoid protein Co-methyltransferase